jgi:hypothetical protein
MEEYTLPKIIWTYWNDKNINSPMIRYIKKNNKIILKNWTIHFISDDDIIKYIPKNAYPSNFYTLGVQHRADWIRLYLLVNYGGVWLDAGITINSLKDFDNIHTICNESKIELAGFYYEKMIKNNNPRSYIENWFIMGPLKSNVLKLWLNEFEYAISIGFNNYKNLNYKGNEYIYDKFNVYLTQHVCLQTVLNKKINYQPNILLFKAENDMFKLNHDCNYNQLFIIYRYIYDKKVKEIPFIKLTGGERHVYDGIYYLFYINIIIIISILLIHISNKLKF